MPTVLGPAYAPDFVGRPPGLSRNDLLLWQHWIPTVRHQISRAYFNVRLGVGKPAPSTGDPTMDRLWIELTQKRADAVLVATPEVWIVELRDTAELSSLGRLAAYGVLWAQDPVLPGLVRLLLVTNQPDPDLAAAAAAIGIIYTPITIPESAELP